MVRGAHDPEIPEEALTRQIGFAERWLTRAKQEVSSGNRARGILALLLAEAEVHHARETAAPARAIALPRPAPIATLLAVGLLAGLLLAVPALLAPPDLPTGTETTAAVIRFKHQVGSTLALIPVAAARGEETAVAAQPAAKPAAVTRPSRPAPIRRTMVRSTVRRTASAPRATAIAPPPQLLSESELIDLVLAAERSLRGER